MTGAPLEHPSDPVAAPIDLDAALSIMSDPVGEVELEEDPHDVEPGELSQVGVLDTHPRHDVFDRRSRPGHGQLGVAVQSHYFSVGSVVGWAEPGVGVVATQSLVEISYGPRGLERMRLGDTAPEALAALVAGDDGRALRQVAIVDAAGRVATHTGERCIAEAGHVMGDGWSVQANMMRDPGVPEAMAAAFSVADGDLTARLLAALDAAEAAGGDIRGRQSAPWSWWRPKVSPGSGLFDVRVDDHGDPLAELRRLVACAGPTWATRSPRQHRCSQS